MYPNDTLAIPLPAGRPRHTALPASRCRRQAASRRFLPRSCASGRPRGTLSSPPETLQSVPVRRSRASCAADGCTSGCKPLRRAAPAGRPAPARQTPA